MLEQYLTLARKYRPKKFSELIGQNIVVTILQNIIKSNNTHHAYLLTGTRGVGKTTTARIIAKALNCPYLNDSEPCCACDICLQIDCGNCIDVYEIDGASNTGVDNIREIIENVKYYPSQAKYKVYIIDEVHMLSKSAFNAMLKTLEEPPTYAVFILATTEIAKIPITILSRSLQLELKHLLIDDIVHCLNHIIALEQINCPAGALVTIAKTAAGSMRDALSLLDQLSAFTDKNITTDKLNQMLGISDDDVILQLIDAIINVNAKKLMNLAYNIHHNSHDFAYILDNLSQKFCAISIMQLTNNIDSNQQNNIIIDESPECLNQLQHYAAQININTTHLYFEICNLGLKQIKVMPNKYAIFLMTLMRMLAFNLNNDANVNNSNIITNPANQNDMDLNTTDVINNSMDDMPLDISSYTNQEPEITAIADNLINSHNAIDPQNEQNNLYQNQLEIKENHEQRNIHPINQKQGREDLSSDGLSIQDTLVAMPIKDDEKLITILDKFSAIITNNVKITK